MLSFCRHEYRPQKQTHMNDWSWCKGSFTVKILRQKPRGASSRRMARIQTFGSQAEPRVLQRIGEEWGVNQDYNSRHVWVIGCRLVPGVHRSPDGVQSGSCYAQPGNKLTGERHRWHRRRGKHSGIPNSIPPTGASRWLTRFVHIVLVELGDEYCIQDKRLGHPGAFLWTISLPDWIWQAPNPYFRHPIGATQCRRPDHLSWGKVGVRKEGTESFWECFLSGTLTGTLTIWVLWFRQGQLNGVGTVEAGGPCRTWLPAGIDPLAERLLVSWVNSRADLVAFHVSQALWKNFCMKGTADLCFWRERREGWQPRKALKRDNPVIEQVRVLWVYSIHGRCWLQVETEAALRGHRKLGNRRGPPGQQETREQEQPYRK